MYVFYQNSSDSSLLCIGNVPPFLLICHLPEVCICCTLREDLLLEVNKLAKGDRFDYLVIESTGICEPLLVAETFTFADEDGVSHSDVSTLDTMVTVVGAGNFLRDYDEAKDLQETGESLGDEDERSVTDLLLDQVEFADVLLISKTDLVEESEIEGLTAILKSLNTNARIIPISKGQISTDEVLNTKLFNFERAQQAPGWLREMRGEHVPETEEYGIGSFSYVARLPFHPERAFQFFHNTDKYGKLIWYKGYFWLAPPSGIRLAMESGRWNRLLWICQYVLAFDS